MLAGWPGITADFAGLSRDTDEPITVDHIDWAEVIAVMEARQTATPMATRPLWRG